MSTMTRNYTAWISTLTGQQAAEEREASRQRELAKARVNEAIACYEWQHRGKQGFESEIRINTKAKRAKYE
jgi:hypothetical protein